MISECKEERVNLTSTAKNKRKSKSKSICKRIDLVGRRIVMTADVFGGSANECYNGVVTRKSKYREKGKVRNGFQVNWHNGDVDFWYVRYI